MAYRYWWNEMACIYECMYVLAEIIKNILNIQNTWELSRRHTTFSWHTYFPQLFEKCYSIATELTFLIQFIDSSSQEITFEQIEKHSSRSLDTEKDAEHRARFWDPKQLRDSNLHMANWVEVWDLSCSLTFEQKYKNVSIWTRNRQLQHMVYWNVLTRHRKLVTLKLRQFSRIPAKHRIS